LLFPGDWSFGENTQPPDIPPGKTSWEFIPKDGRVLIQPIFKSTFNRGDQLKRSTPSESIVYRDHVVAWSREVKRSVDYLLDRGDIDADAIGFFGISWGSRVGPIMLSNEPRFKAAVLHVGGLRFQRSLPEVDPFHFLPRIQLPVIMINGRYDFYFPYETSQVPFFETLGTEASHKELHVFETSHSLPGNEATKLSLAWFDKYLGPLRR